MFSYLSHQPLVRTKINLQIYASWQSIYCLCNEIIDVGRILLHRVRNLYDMFKTFVGQCPIYCKQNVHSKIIINVKFYLIILLNYYFFFTLSHSLNF